jgi:FkbM family methyltransferase
MNRQHRIPQLLVRAWPFPRGAGRIIDRFFRNLEFRTDYDRIVTTDGFPMSVIPSDLIGRHLYLSGEFDRTTVEVLLMHARPGDMLLDVGANIGYVSACFLAKVPDSTVLAVDPQPKILDLLKTNLNQFGNRARIAPVAISDHDGAGHMAVNTENRGASRLVSEPTEDAAPVDMWSPARLFDHYEVQKVDLLKIDVEGHEESVFRALEPFLCQFRPRAIMFEDHGTQAAPDAPIGALLRRCGYTVQGVKKRLTRLDFPPIAAAADCCYNDYVATRV